jgi:hypothetical protein
MIASPTDVQNELIELSLESLLPIWHLNAKDRFKPGCIQTRVEGAGRLRRIIPGIDRGKVMDGKLLSTDAKAINDGGRKAVSSRCSAARHVNQAMNLGKSALCRRVRDPEVDQW